MSRRRSLRAAEFVPALGGAAYGWHALHEPLRLIGLGLAEAVALSTWPVVVLALVFGVPAVAALAVPRGWRQWWRHGAVVPLLWWQWQLRGTTRPAIPVRFRRAIFAADRYRCAYCRSGAGLQIDHVRPWACGGLSSLWNMVTLCARCNKTKSNYWRYPSGLIVYRPFAGFGDERAAAAILAVERAKRWSLARWLRAAWAL